MDCRNVSNPAEQNNNKEVKSNKTVSFLPNQGLCNALDWILNYFNWIGEIN